MFAFLRGLVAAKPVGACELDINGVGYYVHVPDTVHRRLLIGADATLLTYCHIREDAFQIFGFLRAEEKALFTSLLSISGVGPKVALTVLSGMSVQEFGRAVVDSDVGAFTKISGIGKKGAQRIILEMKTKLGQDTELSELLGEKPDSAIDSDDVIAALCSLGCTIGEAKKAAAAARKQLGDKATVEDLIKAALRTMAKV